jgi:hypothetical protein
VIQILVDLLHLDQWLAATAPVPPALPPFTTPNIAALNQQIVNLIGEPLPAAWQTLSQLLSDLYYLALILSALEVNFSLTEVLGVLTRWLLVIGLVNDLQQNPSPIQTPDDVYAALRWRTLVLPDVISLILLLIRSQRAAVLVRNPGFADLYITREEWDHYEAAEIASIENILQGELKNRVHVVVNQTQVTTTTETTTTTVKEQDSTTTDQTQLQQQSSSDISLAAQASGQVDTSGLYGTTQVNTHLGGSLNYSSASATSRATTQSHETVARAVSKIEQTTRQVRSVSTLTREKDREEHEFDNKQGEQPVVGIYRWVDQIQNVELDRYPNRFLMEFEIPEPGARTRWVQHNNAGRNMINQPPIPLTVHGTATEPPLQPTDIAPSGYAGYVARYNATGISAPPSTQLVISENLTFPPFGQKETEDDWHADSNLSIPNGYQAVSGTAAVLPSWSDTTGVLYIALGAGTPVSLSFNDAPQKVALTVGPISVGTIPFAVDIHQLWGFSITVEIVCEPLPQTWQQWQESTYELIVAAYNNLLQAYNDEKAGLSVQQTNPVDMNSPDQNSDTITQELKRQVIEMLTGAQFNGLGAINWYADWSNPPTTILSTAASEARKIQFLEQAFEWETMSYICYPYYWADSSRWAALSQIVGDDSNFADFLRAGSARVVLAARPGFEDQVNFYVLFGILWGGGPMPAPDDPDYLSIADEIKAMQQGPTDVTVIDAWQVRLPTTLIWLNNSDPDGQLPKNPSPTIDTTPKIVGLLLSSGAIGDPVTIAGRSFGDIQGNSTVSFNGTAAATVDWSAISIDVTVPTGATSGPVVVTVNGVASTGMNFSVT